MEAKLQQQAPQKAQTNKPNLTGIPTQMKLDFEQRSGLSFDDVRVHYNSDKPAQLQALAYTQGTQVYVGPGQERHLKHELGHVVQQKSQYITQTIFRNNIPINISPKLERQAEYYTRNRIPPMKKHTQTCNRCSTVQCCPDPDDLQIKMEDCTDSFASEDDDEFSDVYSMKATTSLLRTSQNTSNSLKHAASLTDDRKDKTTLKKDADAIFAMLKKGPAQSGTTVVCANFVDKNGKNLNLAMTNGVLPPLALRQEMVRRGYSFLHGIKTHAETNLVMYALKHKKNLTLKAFGCDKETCPQCDEILKAVKLPLTYSTRKNENFSKKYHFSPKKGRYMEALEAIIRKHYDKEGVLIGKSKGRRTPGIKLKRHKTVKKN